MRTSRERKPKGSRRGVRLVGAVFFGGLAAWAGWQAPSIPRQGLALMLVGIALAVPAGLLARSWWYRTPYDISARVPRRLSRPARVRWIQRPFLGWTVGWLGGPRFAVGTDEDSVGVVGPTRVNKTAGVALTQAVMWSGPLISVAPKPQMFRETAWKRRQLADMYGGEVVIYAPTEEGRVEGLRPLKFSPSSSTDPNVVKLRVGSWVEAAATAKNVENADHWRTWAAKLLRGLFLASAHHRVRPGDFRLVRGWLTKRSLEEPIQVLRSLRSFAGDQWAEELEGIQNTQAEKERDSFFSAAGTTIDATSSPSVLRSTTETGIDPERFLLTRSSLYIVSPTEHQRSVAPLISMLVSTIVHTAYRLHREGRLEGRLLLSLDDLANCAPLPELESAISQGGGQGVNVAWNLQSFAQLSDHYGNDQAQAIWSTTRCKVVFGGLTDEGSVGRLSSSIGEERVVAPGESETDRGRRGSKHVTWRPLLSPAQLRQIPDGWAVLLYHNQPARMLREPLAAKRYQVARHMTPWRVADHELRSVAAPEQPPVLTVLREDEDVAAAKEA